MIRTFTKQILSTALSFLLVITAVPLEAAGQEPAPAGSTGYSGQGAPLTAPELQQLVAPIALYPDALVAQILGARDLPGPGRCRQQLASAKQESHWHSSMKAVDAQSGIPV